ncbi:PAS domain S-box-containing protein [Dethiosulfatibacter aminovorans DSM 17477]|uniref:PAS domain S-box-containing protein n=1 Tax=Dethiosulfatibacter aminovorans DSM 17477 TaxID=1121476 RepID=A0A1M6AHS8_9FIRM|nr:sigma 54-interacting transcriptional regulator [Dethiosulfatibacter aminovorans]SHI35992.1 PAS domain S-box-containing protein [Dethiosulfatibacter aminovorans DSM 17477]
MDSYNLQRCEENCNSRECCENRVKEVTAKLTKMFERLNSIIESSYDGIYITDGEGKTLQVNKAYEKLTGINRDKLIGRMMVDLEKEGTISKSATMIVLNTRKTVTLEQTIKNKKKLLVTANPIWNKNGEIDMVVTNVRDITELDHLKQEVAKSKVIMKQMQYQMLQDDSIIVQDPKSFKMIDMANRVSRKCTTVIITGETGTGKEVMARYIHNHSKRKDEAFIKVNCGAIPENLIESELFGYEKGSFTGAVNSGKTGIIEAADKGTLFLDEIGELPLSAQVKLLRVLQEGEVRKLGSVKDKKVDVRIIAATNRNLRQMIREGKFREDLYYRLNIVPLKLLPLRERKDDIIPMALDFLTKYNEEYEESKSFSPEVLDLFYNYEWPGNIRQLKNIVERCYVLTEGRKILKEAVPFEIRGRDNLIEKTGEISNMKKAVAVLEMEMIEKSFNKYGNVRDAAKSLGIDASTLVRKRKKYANQ